MNNVTLSLGYYQIDCFINDSHAYIEIINPKTCEFYEFTTKDISIIHDILLKDVISVFYKLLPNRFLEEFPNMSTSFSFVKSNLYFFVTSTPQHTTFFVKNLTNLSSKTIICSGEDLFIKTYNGDESALYNIFVLNVFIESFLLHYLHSYSDKNSPQIVRDYYFKNTAHRFYTTKISRKFYSKIKSPTHFLDFIKTFKSRSNRVDIILSLIS